MQKNIKKNKGVKDWPWWKLFTTVRPLIEVQLSEEQIRNKDVRNSLGRPRCQEGRAVVHPRGQEFCQLVLGSQVLLCLVQRAGILELCPANRRRPSGVLAEPLGILLG